jgi:hypothetical protein
MRQRKRPRRCHWRPSQKIGAEIRRIRCRKLFDPSRTRHCTDDLRSRGGSQPWRSGRSRWPYY